MTTYDDTAAEYAALRADAESLIRATLGEDASAWHPLAIDAAVSAVANARQNATSDAPGIRPFPWIRGAVRALRRLKLDQRARRRILTGRRH